MSNKHLGRSPRFAREDVAEIREQLKGIRAPASYTFGELSVSVNDGQRGKARGEHEIALSCTPDSCGPFLYEHLLFTTHHIDLLFRGIHTIGDLSNTAGMLSIIADRVGIPQIAAYVHDSTVLEDNLQRNHATASIWRDLTTGWTARPQVVYLDFQAFPSLALVSRAFASLRERGRLAITGLISAHREAVLSVLKPACRLSSEQWINEWTGLIFEKRRGGKR
jgi:hypothetical protein